MLLYVGPDQIIPLSGAVGTFVGLALILWGRLTLGVRRFARLLSSKSGELK